MENQQPGKSTKIVLAIILWNKLVEASGKVMKQLQPCWTRAVQSVCSMSVWVSK